MKNKSNVIMDKRSVLLESENTYTQFGILYSLSICAEDSCIKKHT